MWQWPIQFLLCGIGSSRQQQKKNEKNPFDFYPSCVGFFCVVVLSSHIFFFVVVALCQYLSRLRWPNSILWFGSTSFSITLNIYFVSICVRPPHLSGHRLTIESHDWANKLGSRPIKAVWFLGHNHPGQGWIVYSIIVIFFFYIFLRKCNHNKSRMFNFITERVALSM